MLQLVAEGFANKQIAAELSISIKTVEKHRQQAMNKLESSRHRQSDPLRDLQRLGASPARRRGFEGQGSEQGYGARSVTRKLSSQTL